MASTHAYNEIKAHAQSVFAPTYGVFDWDQIEDAKQQGSDPFLVLEEVSANEDLIAVGDPTQLCHREEGFLALHFFTPAPESSVTARTLAESVQTAFRHQRLNGLRVTNVDPPELSRLNDGLWSLGTCLVQYEYDSYHAIP